MPGTIDGGTRKGRINVSYSYSRWCTSYLACCYWLDSYCCDPLSLYKKSAECSTRTKDSSYWYCLAIIIICMKLEIVPIAYHINMSVIAGIVLRPTLGFISVFIVDLMIAMFGHGGFTVVGLNTLVVGTEAAVGFYFFHAFLGLLSSSKISAGLSAALATMLSLIISTSLMIGIVYLSQVNPEKILHVDKENFIGKVFSLGPHRENEKHEMQDNNIDIETFAKTFFFLGMFGWILEAVISGFVIRYVSRVRPDLILSEAT